MPNTVSGAAFVGANDDQLIRNERIAVEARLVSVLVNIVAPPHFASPFVEGVEGTGA
jgi:hypothetical protein